MPAFARYISVDYSGAKTPNASLEGLRVYMAERDAPLAEVSPPPSLCKYWTRRGVAEWLVEKHAEDVAALVGVDHGFSFPLLAAWVTRADRDGSLTAFLNPDLTPPECAVAEVEGWTLGVPGLIRAGKERNALGTFAPCEPGMLRLH